MLMIECLKHMGLVKQKNQGNFSEALILYIKGNSRPNSNFLMEIAVIAIDIFLLAFLSIKKS